MVKAGMNKESDVNLRLHAQGWWNKEEINTDGAALFGLPAHLPHIKRKKYRKYILYTLCTFALMKNM